MYSMIAEYRKSGGKKPSTTKEPRLDTSCERARSEQEGEFKLSSWDNIEDGISSSLLLWDRQEKALVIMLQLPGR